MACLLDKRCFLWYFIVVKHVYKPKGKTYTDMNKEIYFDNAATTVTDKDAASVALELMCTFYGNPSSAHGKGLEAEHLLKKARKSISSALGYSERDGYVCFTSCGTEATNMAFFGTHKLFSKRMDNIIISDSEHPSVENCALELEKAGVTVHRIPTKGGVLDLDFAKNTMNDKTMLVSCMLVNNETGAIYDIASLKKLRDTYAKNAYLHVDAVQGFTKLGKKLSFYRADLISISGHKVHAPKGIGALYISKGVRTMPLLYGGGQENTLRSGTESLPLICAFGKACEIAVGDEKERIEKIKSLNSYTRELLKETCPDVIINSKEDFAPNILSISANGIRSEIMLRYLSDKGIYVSAGSACSSKHANNRVLSNFGLDDKTADSTIRISFSKYNTQDEVNALCSAISQGCKTLIHTV